MSVLLLAMLLLPLVGSVVRRRDAAGAGQTAKLTALGFSLVELVLAVAGLGRLRPPRPGACQLTSSSVPTGSRRSGSTSRSASTASRW